MAEYLGEDPATLGEQIARNTERVYGSWQLEPADSRRIGDAENG
jgi:hypothetical protein